MLPLLCTLLMMHKWSEFDGREHLLIGFIRTSITSIILIQHGVLCSLQKGRFVYLWSDSTLQEVNVTHDIHALGGWVIYLVPISTLCRPHIDSIPCPDSEFPLCVGVLHQNSAPKCPDLGDIWLLTTPLL